MYIYRIGMLTPLGPNAEMTRAAFRAGVSAYCETHHIGVNDQPIKMALVPQDALPPLHRDLASGGFTKFKKRLIQLAAHALAGACDDAVLKTPVPVFLAGPESRSSGKAVLDTHFLHALQKQTGINFDVSSSRLFHLGRAGGIYAIELAYKYIESTGQDFVIVGGVDSYNDMQRLGQYDADGRLLTAASMDGFIPGEAAGFLLLMSDSAAERLNTGSKAFLHRPGVAEEPGHYYSVEPYRGEGLAKAIQKALTQSKQRNVKAVYTSLNGEHYWGKELGVSLSRNHGALADGYSIEHPADCFGDIGAAFGPVMLGIMSHNESGEYLAYCSSDCQARSAVSLSVL